MTLQGKEIGKLKLGTREYRFCEVLFENLNSVVSHEKMGVHLDVATYNNETNTYTSKTGNKLLSNYLSDIKSRIPNTIRSLISNAKGGYSIDTTVIREI